MRTLWRWQSCRPQRRIDLVILAQPPGFVAHPLTDKRISARIHTQAALFGLRFSAGSAHEFDGIGRDLGQALIEAVRKANELALTAYAFPEDTAYTSATGTLKRDRILSGPVRIRMGRHGNGRGRLMQIMAANCAA